MDPYFANTMQTLQIYKREEKIPTDVRIRRMLNTCETVRRTYLLPKALKGYVSPEDKKKEEPLEPPTVKSIEFQNTLMKLEKKLAFWANDYRNLIDELRELERLQPKNKHELEESDRKAKENVQKIIKIETIREEFLKEFSSLCIRYEETESSAKKRIKQLESDLAKAQGKVENLEYDLEKRRNKH